MPDLTVSELGRRYGVSHSTVARAVARATGLNADGAPVPPPPAPVNPGEPQLRYPAGEMDAWWPNRPPRGRPGGRPEPDQKQDLTDIHRSRPAATAPESDTA